MWFSADVGNGITSVNSPKLIFCNYWCHTDISRHFLDHYNFSGFLAVRRCRRPHLASTFDKLHTILCLLWRDFAASGCNRTEHHQLNRVLNIDRLKHRLLCFATEFSWVLPFEGTVLETFFSCFYPFSVCLSNAHAMCIFKHQTIIWKFPSSQNSLVSAMDIPMTGRPTCRWNPLNGASLFECMHVDCSRYTFRVGIKCAASAWRMPAKNQQPITSRIHGKSDHNEIWPARLLIVRLTVDCQWPVSKNSPIGLQLITWCELGAFYASMWHIINMFLLIFDGSYVSHTRRSYMKPLTTTAQHFIWRTCSFYNANTCLCACVLPNGIMLHAVDYYVVAELCYQAYTSNRHPFTWLSADLVYAWRSTPKFSCHNSCAIARLPVW